MEFLISNILLNNTELSKDLFLFIYKLKAFLKSEKLRHLVVLKL